MAAALELDIPTPQRGILSKPIFKKVIDLLPEPSQDELLSASRRVQAAYRSTLPTDQEIDMLQVVQSQESHSLFALSQPTRRQRRAKKVLPQPPSTPTEDISIVLGNYQTLYNAGQEKAAYATLTNALINRFHASL